MLGGALSDVLLVLLRRPALRLNLLRLGLSPRSLGLRWLHAELFQLLVDRRDASLQAVADRVLTLSQQLPHMRRKLIGNIVSHWGSPKSSVSSSSGGRGAHPT